MEQSGVPLPTQQSGLVYLAHVPSQPGGREFAYGNLVCLLPGTEQLGDMFWLAVAESRPALTEKGSGGHDAAQVGSLDSGNGIGGNVTALSPGQCPIRVRVAMIEVPPDL